MRLKVLWLDSHSPSHVSSISAKLEVSDRTQAAVFAWRHGLVRDGD